MARDPVAAIVDVTIPGGSDWTVKGSAARTWTYRSKTGGGGLTRARVRGNSASRELSVRVRGKGTFPASGTSVPLALTIVVDPPAATDGRCGESVFPTSACRVKPTSIACK